MADKQIVSKAEYIVRVGKKTALRFGSVSLVGGAGFVFLLAVCCLCVGMLLWSESVLFGALWLTGFALVLALAFGTFYMSGKYMEKARSIDPGVPLTQTNIAQLPAPESLVRASEEPKQVQESVLLRAATETHETPPEQLVRAAGAE